jgi:hypothetical protein
MSFIELLKAARFAAVGSAMIAAALLTAATLSAQAPNLSGTWQMDPAKSQVSDGRSVSLVIQSPGNKVKVDETIHDKNGKETTADFTCAPDGKECEFNEGGHKSKMSMWFSGDSLNLAKTDGPPGDVVSMWKLQTSSEGKVLTLTVNHIEPAGPDETLVFTKKTS